MIAIMLGCGSLKGLKAPKANSLAQARQLLTAGELYRAKKIASEALEKTPGNAEAEILMAQILAAEIARQKEIFEAPAPEDLSQKQNEEEIKTLLERARSLAALGELEPAIQTAEGVFLYDPMNKEASQLIDKIRGRALSEDRSFENFRAEVREAEVDDRVEHYRNEAKAAFQKGEMGRARLYLEKVLLLSPEDSEAHKLYERVTRG